MGLPTPVIVDKLKPFIQGYKYCDYIIEGFSTGFDICHNGEVQLKNEQNSKRLSLEDNIVGQKILEEIAKGRIAGPFNEPPFQNLHCSPLFLVPKKSGDFRLIHNLSAPVGHSVNDGISKSDSSVQYQNLSHAIQIVKKLGRGCLLAKVDIESAFRIIPLNKSNYHLLGFTWKEQFYFDRCLAMGAASSCSIFEKFSTSLHWAMENIGHKNIVHILDDFLFVGPSNAPHCLNSLLAFQNMCSFCGIPLKDAKTVGPCTTLEFLGATIDTIAMEVRLPEDKIQKIKLKLDTLIRKEKATLKELQSLLGLLNFACFVVTPGRAFMRRIIDLTVGLKKPFHHRRLTLEAKADMQSWLTFLNSFNGKCLILDNRWVTTITLSLYTDASNLGFGCIFGNKWCYGTWPSSWGEHHITLKELYTIILAIELWGHNIKNRCIVLFSDKAAVVTMLNKHTTKHKLCMALIRRFVIKIMSDNILVQAQHIAGKFNNLADNLSRLQIAEFQKGLPTAEPLATPIPTHLLPT